MKCLASIIFIFMAAQLVSMQNDYVFVKLKQGTIKGNVVNLQDTKYYKFLGIQYAKPPVGDLRFKDPQPVVQDQMDSEPTGTIDAMNFKSVCPQWKIDGTLIGDEDCLHLNVFTSQLTTDETYNYNPYPVMVFLHGGNFQTGSSDMYDAENFMARRVVVVTLNYRIGILGFLSTGDSSCPGNLGLKDQTMALKWVKENIENFGGDPNSVTLFGQGAGAVSTFLHILSPQSAGLFHRAITQSGSPLCDWAMEENPRTYAQTVADRLSCTKKSTKAMFDCIRSKPFKEIMNAQISNEGLGGFPIRTQPVVERNGFLPEKPQDLLKTKSYNMPLIAGFNKDDGTFFYKMTKYKQEDWKDKSFMTEKLIPLFLRTATDTTENIQSISETINYQYFNGMQDANMTSITQAFINMSTDSAFISCHYKTIELYAAAGANVFMYTFEYRGKNSMLELENSGQISYPGVSHGDELLYLFKIATKDVILDNTDNKRKSQMEYLWTSFARQGMPVPSPNMEFRKWEPFTKDLKNYYSIGTSIDDTLEQKFGYRHREADFWIELLPALSKVRMDSSDQYAVTGFGWTMMVFAIILLVAVIVLVVVLYKKRKEYVTTPTSEVK